MVTGQSVNLAERPSMAVEWSDGFQWLGGAAVWSGVSKLLGTYREKKEEKRNDEVHTFEQLKKVVELMDVRLGKAEERLKEQDELIHSLKNELFNENQNVKSLKREKMELEKNITDLEERLKTAVAKGAGIAASLQKSLNWYRSELQRVIELYEQATGLPTPGTPHAPYPLPEIDHKEV